MCKREREVMAEIFIRSRRAWVWFARKLEYLNFYDRMSLVLCASLTNMDVVTVALRMEEEAEECALLQEFWEKIPTCCSGKGEKRNVLEL